MPARLKQINFQRTLYWELKQNDYKLEKLYQYGVISFKIIRGIKIADTIYEQCYKNCNRNKGLVEMELAELYQVSTETINNTWNQITTYIK